MNRTRIPALASAALLAFALAACGGGDVDAAGAPKNADEKKFCEAWNKDNVSQDADAGELADGLHDAAKGLADVGTPKGISQDARNGFELFAQTMADIDEDGVKKFQSAATPEEIGKALDLSEDESADLMAFVTFAETTCA